MRKTLRSRLGVLVAVILGGVLAASGAEAGEFVGPTTEHDGHIYALVDAGVTLSWQEAREAAELLTYPVVEADGGVLVLDGHLATITAAEYPDVIRLSNGWVKAWVGGWFDHDASEWMWITGEPLPMNDPNWPPPPVSEQDDPLTDPIQDVLILDFAARTSMWEGFWSWHNTQNERRYIVEFEPPMLRVDIKPGSDRNRINSKSNGVVPVALLGSATFDVTRLDISTIVFGPGEAAAKHVAGHFADVNRDGHLDMKLHFPTPEAGLALGDTDACVRGETLGGTTLIGCDLVTVIK